MAWTREKGKTKMIKTIETGSLTARHICKMFRSSRSRTLQTALVFHVLSLLLSTCLGYPQFSEQNSVFSLQTIAVDAQRDTVFIGSVNRVYKLNSNLSLEQETVTGPVQDSPECWPRSVGCPSAVPTDNYNKVLLVDDDRLVICGTVYQGVCDVLTVDTLSVLSNSSMTEVSVNTDYGTTVAFIGNGPGDVKTLYVGSSSSEWARGNVWTMSSRQLPSDLSSPSLFQVYNGGGPQENPSLIRIPAGTINDSPIIQKFNITYISGFEANGFSYFIALQPKIPETPSPYFTKLARVCQQDDHFYSYIELPLHCYVYGDDERTLYNLAQSAYVGTVGSDLGSDDLQPGSEVLYVVFAQSDGTNSKVPSDKSAVCIYPLSALDLAFWERRLGCAQKETDRTDIDWLGSVNCGTSNSMISTINSTGPSYCHMNENNSPLGGNSFIGARAVYTHSSVLTSIAATVHRDQTVIFLGDQEGQLKKLWLVDSSTASLYEELTIDPDGGMVQNGMVLTPDENHVYVMTETKV
ncbi:plexin-A2-like [Lytechinus variegatus]|uniref:plexin-A2-like n=1 Tax=Lytechinus variegatus TaxID=7654 RepID=UPI001BB2CF89|nr:plexin-A2-like [Lytechinus variegatus]